MLVYLCAFLLNGMIVLKGGTSIKIITEIRTGNMIKTGGVTGRGIGRSNSITVTGTGRGVGNGKRKKEREG